MDIDFLDGPLSFTSFYIMGGVIHRSSTSMKARLGDQLTTMACSESISEFQ